MITAIVGGNWGDEGKGKLTDTLAQQAEIVIRFQGGANAGHTIVNEHGKFVLHMLPSGVFHQHITNIIAPGVALNIEQLMKELKMLEKGGVAKPNLMISPRTQIVMPYHVLFDQLEEERLKERSFGSTKSGIAPFYGDKYLKVGIQVAQLFDDNLESIIKDRCHKKSLEAKALYQYDKIDAQAVYLQLKQYAEDIKPYVHETTYYLYEAQQRGVNILLEGQLGALKDPDHGIYPFVTSSSPLAGNASVSAAIAPRNIQEVVTVVKAYSSAVGAGAFVSEIFGAEADELRNRGGDGGEYGATTGRPRRMGWLDLVASRYGCILQGTTKVALSLIDVLGYLDEIPVCVAYNIDGKETNQFPTSGLLEKAKPVYQYLPGWKTDIRGITDYQQLPKEAQAYIEFVEESLGFKIGYISTGPDRKDIIVR